MKINLEKMKKVICLIACLALSISLFAQKRKEYFSDEYGNPIHYDVSNPGNRGTLLVLIDGGVKKVVPFKRYGTDYLSYGNMVHLDGATFIELESRIHKDSLKYYRYDIVENDTTYLVNQGIPKKVKFIWNEQSDHPGYFTMDLGNINVVNKKIQVKIYKNLAGVNQITQAIILNRPVQKASIIYQTIYSKGDGKADFIGKPFKSGDTIIVNGKTKVMSIAIKDTKVNFLYDIKLTREKDNSTSYYIGQFKFDGKDEAITNINVSSFSTPGNYTLSITPTLGNYSDVFNDNKETVKIKFTVLPDQEHKFVFSQRESLMIGFLIMTFLGACSFCVWYFVKKKNLKKLKLTQQQKELSQIQLTSIRAQLNPHFMFNALAGIQNLMISNKIDEANRYLGNFARITRNVLANKELISLAEEQALLKDYFEMEQLRFDFAYEIVVDSSLNLDNIEIPAMLLQPFVENAVKHGISTISDEGKVTVSFAKENQNLMLKVQDNGKGFNSVLDYSGFGLKLSKNRISLLNTIYPKNTFQLAMKSSAQGSEVTIILIQWL
jgi:two-component system LytT family sensor kinase